MNSDLPSALLREGLMVLATAGAPMFLTALVVGLAVGILQASTQINDSAASFLPRAAAAVLVAWAAGPWMAEKLAGFLVSALTRMAARG